jgi:leader peptidase (prepilin peptidase)/N-methyltransferase
VAAGLGALLGLVVGSFLNVVAYRVPVGESVVAPGSHCPRCSAPIRPRDNIPVLSWVLLRGRCRDCGEPFSVRYAIVEAATATLFAATPVVLGVSWTLASYWWFIGVGIVLVLTDLDHQRIPNRILYPGVVVGALLLSVGAVADGDAASLPRALGGAVGYFTVLLVLALLARGGLGFGDVKLAVLLGMFTAYLSWRTLYAAGALAIGIGGLVAIGLLMARKRGRKDVIPFGPALIAGAFAALWVGDALVEWYLG